MKESNKKAAILSTGLGLITAGYGLFQAGIRIEGLAAVVVGLLLVFSSQTMHIDREELEDLKKEVSELKGK